MLEQDWKHTAKEEEMCQNTKDRVTVLFNPLADWQVHEALELSRVFNTLFAFSYRGPETKFLVLRGQFDRREVEEVLGRKLPQVQAKVVRIHRWEDSLDVAEDAVREFLGQPA